MSTFLPRYLGTLSLSELRAKAEEASTQLTDCSMCPRRCEVDRTSNQRGNCKTGIQAVIAGFHAHFGEETPLVGQNGSGTIFFSGCNLGCSFCQNFRISRKKEGHAVTDAQLAHIMLELQQMGCHNINLVTPSHVVPQILVALTIAVEKGLNIPLVYNSSGYDSIETLRILDGVIDIFMPDFKFWSSDIAELTCRAKDYPDIARQALTEMHKQVGDLQLKDGIAETGLLVRHLVLPDGMAGTAEVMQFIADEVSPRTYVNIMSQYRPCGDLTQIEPLTRSISQSEYDTALVQTKIAGIHRIDKCRNVFMLQ